jgi:hypothetical protein
MSAKRQMLSFAEYSAASPPTAAFPVALHGALTLLLRAYDYAQEVDCSPCDFAVDFQTLRAHGLTKIDLKWLELKGYVQCSANRTPGERANETSPPPGSRKPAEDTQVILTDAGAAAVRSGLARVAEGNDRVEPSAVPAQGMLTGEHLVPRWDPVRRELWVGNQLVKRYRQPAPNQERILTAFEEEGWPEYIDDPLPPEPAHDPKYHLHVTISNLNRNQLFRCLRFCGDGHGQGVRWQLLV